MEIDKTEKLSQNDIIINNEIIKHLKSDDSRKHYLEIISKRIEENRTKIGKIFTILILVGVSFPLLVEAKILEFSLGPFKITEVKIGLALIPSIFAYLYYKYILLWLEINEQKKIYSRLTSIIFKVNNSSYLNKNIRSFSLIDSLDNFIEIKKSRLGCLALLLWIPVGLIVFLTPFIYEIYMIKSLLDNFKLNSFINWVVFLIPLILTIFTILYLIRRIVNHKKQRPQ